MATKYTTRGIAIMVLAAMATVIAPATSAHALPSDCSRGWDSIQHEKFAWSICANGAGEQRVGIIYVDFDGNYVRTAHGPWVAKGQLSKKEVVVGLNERPSKSIMVSRRP